MRREPAGQLHFVFLGQRPSRSAHGCLPPQKRSKQAKTTDPGLCDARPRVLSPARARPRLLPQVFKHALEEAKYPMGLSHADGAGR